MLVDIAESGLFLQSGLTAMEAAGKANLYESLHYLSYKHDLNYELKAMQEKANRK